MSISIEERLARGDLVLLDGAMGTELQRRGVPMDDIAWSGAAVLSHPELVRATHVDYVRAGARVIITNTFGSTRQMLGPAGFGDQVEQVHRDAVRLALEAREQAGIADVLIAGSISTEPPGFDRDAFLSPDDELAAYREAAQLLADAGVDLIALEMIVEISHAQRAIQAVQETGLPFWLGIGCRQSGDGRIVSFDRQDIEFSAMLDALLPSKPSIVNIMHSEIRAIPEALAQLKARWDGPIGVYPESGYFTKPHWNFVDVIPPKELAAEAAGWVAEGVGLIGGCCGTGPEHIEALNQALIVNKTS